MNLKHGQSKKVEQLRVCYTEELLHTFSSRSVVLKSAGSDIRIAVAPALELLNNQALSLKYFRKLAITWLE